MLRLGTTGFGGPVALAGYMHQDLVSKRKWIEESDYREGLTLAQMAPGPMATQLAIYLGYVHYRILGATLAGIAFILPSFLMVVGLGWAYMQFGGLHWMNAVFYGVGASVIGIIIMSAWKLTNKCVGKDKLLWAIYAPIALLTIVTGKEMAWLFIAAGVFVWFWRAPPKWFNPRSIKSIDVTLLANMALFFLKAGAFVFGSGLAIVPFLYGGVVTQHHWLTEQQFVDAVAVAMITPGPVVITVAFIGYLTAGFTGACVAALATFFPCYLFTIIPAPYFKKYGKRPDLKAFVDGVTAAAVGAISGSVIIIGKHSITDLPTLMLALVTTLLLWKVKKLPEPVIVAGAAIIGLIVYPLMHKQ
jgi:chromate transporter